MKNTNFALLSFVILMSACSTAKVRILPGETSNKVISTDYEKDDAEEAAAKEATAYCLQYNKRIAFVNPSNKTEYTGKMDEGTRHTVKKASHAAMILSAPVGAGTGNGAAGGILGSAGLIGHEMVNDRDYKAEWEFKCI
jgi:hypothetical protein